VGQQGRLTRAWSQKGKRPRLNKDLRFEYTYIYGAICPERDIGEAIVIDALGKAVMAQHLANISSRIPTNHHAVIVMDRAPWHHSLDVPENMTVISLPSYSPELNPQENIWQYLKNNFLSNCIFEDLDHITTVCCLINFF
jgi:transposase